MPVKLLVEGDSSTGKTSLLISLVAAGYKVKVWDYDNKLAGLRSFVGHYYPSRTDGLESVALRDKLKSSPNGPILDGPPKAFSTGLDLLDKWHDGSKPAEWGEDYVVVIDTLTTMTQQAAFNWAKLMNGAMNWVVGVPTKNVDPRNLIYIAQQAVLSQLSYLTAEWFNTNVIVMSHIKYFDRPDGQTKSYPVSIGSAIAAEIPASFPNVVQLETQNVGGTTTRVIRTVSTPMIDLQNPVPFKMPKQIEVPDLVWGDTKNLEETGLAKYFDLVRST
jgi:hypothetical protein